MTQTVAMTEMILFKYPKKKPLHECSGFFLGLIQDHKGGLQYNITPPSFGVNYNS